MNFCRGILWLSLLLVALLVSPALAGGAGELAQENGVLENTQIALLLLSGLVFVVQSFSVERNLRFILWMGVWLSPSIILRELDIETLAVPQWVIAIGSGTGRNLIMGVGWIALCLLAIKSYSTWKGSFRRIARSRMAIFMYSAVTMLLLGSLFDHRAISEGQGKLWEELFETIGYFLLLPAAFFSKSILQSSPAAHMLDRELSEEQISPSSSER